MMWGGTFIHGNKGKGGRAMAAQTGGHMKKRKPEVSSARVAKIAGRVQNIIQHFKGDYDFLFMYLGDDTYAPLHLRLKDVGTLAGSALTQTANRPKPKKNGRVKRK